MNSDYVVTVNNRKVYAWLNLLLMEIDCLD